MKRPRIFYSRLWLGDMLFTFAAWVMPESRTRHRYTDDGEAIAFWRVPA